MAEDEKTKQRNDLKIKKPAYKGYDDDEFAPGTLGMKRAVLAKYDDVINGESHEVCFVSIPRLFTGASSRSNQRTHNVP